MYNIQSQSPSFPRNTCLIVYKSKLRFIARCMTVPLRGNADGDGRFCHCLPRRVLTWNWHRSDLVTSTTVMGINPYIYIYIYICVCVCVCVITCNRIIGKTEYFNEKFSIIRYWKIAFFLFINRYQFAKKEITIK